MRRRIIAASVVSLCAVAAVVASPAAPPAASVDTTLVQAQHLAVVERIAQWDALAGTSRLGTIEGDPVAGTIDVGWVGEVPEALQAIAEEAAAQTIDVRFVEQAASEAELTELAADLAGSLAAEGAFSIVIDDAGLTLQLPSEQAAAAVGAEPIALDAAAAAAVDEVERRAAELGSALTVEQTDAVPATSAAVTTGRLTTGPLATGRSDDTGVLSGGMRVQTQLPSGAWQACTSGFPAVQGHRPVIVTAAHCSGYRDDRPVRTASGARIGTSDLVAELNDGAQPYDLGVIAAPVETRTLPRVYTSETSTVTIVDAMRTVPPAGYGLCSAGASGWRCDLTAGAASIACFGAPHGSECARVQLVRAASATAFCAGDSGGPVVAPPTAAGAVAAGVISGMRATGSGACAAEGYIAPIADLFRAVHGVQLHTTPAPPCLPATSTPAQCASGERAVAAILDALAAERARAGLPPLLQDACLASLAGDWAATSAGSRLAAGAHNPQLDARSRACLVPTWAENVGRTLTAEADATRMMSAWMASSAHRANILRADVTHVGVGVARGTNGYWYFVLDFGRR